MVDMLRIFKTQIDTGTYCQYFQILLSYCQFISYFKLLLQYLGSSVTLFFKFGYIFLQEVFNQMLNFYILILLNLWFFFINHIYFLFFIYYSFSNKINVFFSAMLSYLCKIFGQLCRVSFEVKNYLFQSLKVRFIIHCFRAIILN